MKMELIISFMLGFSFSIILIIFAIILISMNGGAALVISAFSCRLRTYGLAFRAIPFGAVLGTIDTRIMFQSMINRTIFDLFFIVSTIVFIWAAVSIITHYG